MNRRKSLFSRIRWISAVAARFARVDRSGRSAVTSFLATLGVCCGVMTLVTVMSVMNGFQMSFIDSILEISSYHLRVSGIPDAMSDRFRRAAVSEKGVVSVSRFREAQTLMTGRNGRESAAVIRAVEPSVMESDDGFRRELEIVSGSFDLSSDDSVVLGSYLARRLGVRTGDRVNLLVMSGGADVNLLSADRILTVTGLFTSGYSEINGSYAFISLESAKKYFGASSGTVWGIKLRNSSDDAYAVSCFRRDFPDADVSSWRDYNKSFFGALRIEKNMLMLLVALIFIVVGINIYNGTRRLVFERRTDIAVFSAIGAGASEIKSIFLMRGFMTGAAGSVSGAVLGLLVSVNTQFLFGALSSVMYHFQCFFAALFSPDSLIYIQENMTYGVYADIPARIFFPEVLLTACFGLAAPVLASWAAGRNVLEMTPAEVLHDE